MYNAKNRKTRSKHFYVHARCHLEETSENFHTPHTSSRPETFLSWLILWIGLLQQMWPSVPSNTISRCFSLHLTRVLVKYRIPPHWACLIVAYLSAEFHCCISLLLKCSKLFLSQDVPHPSSYRGTGRERLKHIIACQKCFALSCFVLLSVLRCLAL